MKIVTIGAGAHAALTHGPALAAIAAREPDLELAAVCDIRRGRAEQFSRQFGFRRVYTDYEEMLDLEQPSGVTLLVSEAMTAEIGSAILRRNIPLLLEKPPGRNMREHNLLLQAYRLRRTPHLVAFNRRYMPLVTQARRLWQQLVPPEKLQSIRCDFYRHNRHDPDFSTTAIHGIDLVAFLADASYTESRIQLQRNQAGECTTISLWCEMSGNICTQFLFCPQAGCSFERIHMVSEHYAMTLELPALGTSDIPGRIVLYHKGRLLREIPMAGAAGEDESFLLGGFYHENLAFVEMVRRGQFNPANADLERVVSIVRVTEMVSRAISAPVAAVQVGS